MNIEEQIDRYNETMEKFKNLVNGYIFNYYKKIYKEANSNNKPDQKNYASYHIFMINKYNNDGTVNIVSTEMYGSGDFHTSFSFGDLSYTHIEYNLINKKFKFLSGNKYSIDFTEEKITVLFNAIKKAYIDMNWES